jgi:hypothetical protein
MFARFAASTCLNRFFFYLLATLLCIADEIAVYSVFVAGK